MSARIMNFVGGLRFKVAAILLVILGVFAIGNIYLYKQQSARTVEVQEREQAFQDLRRLLLALDFQFDQLDAVLGSWSNWTSFYDHAARPSKDFLREELSENGLAQTRIDWLGRIDANNQLADLVEVSAPAGGKILTAFIEKNPDRVFREINALMAMEQSAGCGIMRMDANLMFFCYRPLLNSDGGGSARGSVIIGRHIAAQMLRDIAKQVALDFTIVPAQTDAMNLPQGEPMADLIRARVGSSVPYFRLGDSTIRMEFPIMGFFGKAVGIVELTLERTAMMHAQRANEQALVSLIFLIILAGAVVIGVIDKFVVQRIARLKQTLQEIVERNTWDGDIPRDGNDEIGELSGYIGKVIAVVREQLIEMRVISLTDPLTKLANRRHFDEKYQAALKRHERSGESLALLLFDADHFKKYNDIYGHSAGDVVLQGIAQCLQENARRPGDLPTRLGGEEFCLLLENTNLEGAQRCADSVLQSMVSAAFKHEGNGHYTVVTLSCGVAIYVIGETAESLYQRADNALYQAKESGRNRVGVAV